jgi:acyl carrier protein
MREPEVEAALVAHPEIVQAGVAVLGDAQDRLAVVCVVCRSGSLPDTLELRERLTATLPEPVLPAVFVVVDRIPVNPDGQPDRTQLPLAIRGAGSPAAADRRQPAIIDGLAASVADIWREVIQVDAVGLTDNLFDLGGHSLTITRIATRIRGQLGFELPLAVFYDTPTVAGIVAAIEEVRREAVVPG